MSENNKATICGTLTDDAVLGHEFRGEGFYMCSLSVPRLSGTVDILPLMVSDRLIKPEFLKKDAGLWIEGEFRSRRTHNNDDVSRYIFAQSAKIIDPSECETGGNNTITLVGKISVMHEPYVTKSQRTTLNIMVEVTRPGGTKTDFIPCVIWGRNASYAAEGVKGDDIVIEGRTQSRDITRIKDGGYVSKRTIIEVSVANVEITKAAEQPVAPAEEVAEPVADVPVDTSAEAPVASADDVSNPSEEAM